MASSVQTPPPMPPRPRRSMAGPAVLIVLGILFLLGTMGYLNWAILAHWFARYWPVLLIVWGVIKLLEYQHAQHEGRRAPGIGAGGICLLLILICLGLAATGASRFNWGAIGDEIDIDGGDFPMFGNSYTYEDQLSQAFPPGATLHVTDTRGALNIISSDDNELRVVVHKRISASSEQNANKWNDGTKPQITVSGNVVTLNANNQGAGDHWVAEDLDITLPRKASMALATQHGDISVTGRDGDVDLNDQHGDITVSDINGKVSFNADHSSARISQVSSDVSINGRANDVSIEDVKGAVHLDGDFMESVKLEKIGGPVTFRSTRTDMEFSRLDGDLDLDSGNLEANKVGGPVHLTTRSKDIRLTGVSGDTRLQDQNGSIELEIKKLGSIQIQNRKGDVQVYLPDKASFQVDAHARDGEVDSDFAQLKISSDTNPATATGSVGNAGPHIVIDNEEGTIELRKGSSMDEESEAPESPRAPKAPRAPSAPKMPTVTEN